MMDLVARLRMIDNMSKPLRGITGSVTSLSSKLTGMGALIGGLGAGAGLVALGSKALKLASDAEQANISFTTMLGSASQAKTFVDKLSDFANTTPFELPGLRDSAKKMLAFGFAADSVLPMLTGVGNAAAGLSLGSEGVDRLTLALGQMKAKSKVSSDEMLQLVEAGIPAWAILADKMKISTAAVMKLSEKGVIPADQAIQTLIDGMNKRFPDMMAKQSKSLSGLFSTMKDTYNSKILTKFGEGMASALKPRFDKLTRWIDANGDTIDRWGANIERVAGVASDALIGKFEGAGRYLKTHFFNNPDFAKLPDTNSKITFIIDDLMGVFNNWLKDKGEKSITDISGKVVSGLSDAIEAAAPQLLKAGSSLGLSLGDGLWEGLQKKLADHPLLAMLTGAAIGAKKGGLVGAGIGLFGGAAASAVADFKETKKNKGLISDEEQKSRNAISLYFPAKPFQGGYANYKTALEDRSSYLDPTVSPFLTKPSQFAPVNGSHAGGLDRVPYNGYSARLHKDEKVLTAAEAEVDRDNRSSKGSGGITINMTGTVIREEADIKKVANELAREISTAKGGRSYG